MYPLNLHGNGTTCVRSEVYGDQVIRDDRYFSFRFASDSDLVHSSVNTTIVWITDSSSTLNEKTRGTETSLVVSV